jgi:serine/threonine protein kinase
MNVAKQQIDAIFFAALNLAEEGQRRTFLEQSCAGDEALRAAVDRLLAAHAATEDFFGASSHALTLTTEDFQAAADERIFEESVAADERLGSRVGRYKLLQRLGEGGCGVVYMAEQAEPVRRLIALKIIKLGMDTKSVIARFEAERQALAMMDHPNIARVLDAGATGAGRPYFAMELVRGPKLTDFCDQNHLDTRQRLDLFINVCHAIQHAHQKGVIHRDIKPSNILVTLHDGVPVPKVIDFGIAKAIEGRLTENTLFTAYDQVIGTPAYMSPEQAEFSGLDVDTRSDIYSLGILLYELLTGRTPFDSKALAQSGVEGMRRILREEEPQRPSTILTTLHGTELRATAALHREAPPRLISLLRGDLDWIVMKALEKDRTRRYETANGLLADVRRYLNNEPVTARPPSSLYRLQKLVRRNKVAFTAGTAVLLSLVIGLGASTWLFLRERHARQEQSRLKEIADRARSNESRLLLQAEARSRISLAASLLGQGKTDEAAALLAQTPLDSIERSKESADVLRSLGVSYALGGRWPEAAGSFAKVMRMNRSEPNNAVADVGLDLIYPGPVLLESGDTAGYRRFRQEVLDRFGGCTNYVAVEHIFKACLLLPADDPMLQSLEPLARIAERSLADVPASQDRYREHRLLTLALFAYRQGRFTDALSWGRQTLNFPNPGVRVLALCITAMSCQQLGDRETALRELAVATKAVQARFARPLTYGNMNEGLWWDWLAAHQLIREAAALIEPQFER